MATNVVKSVKFETYDGNFNGMVTINLSTEVDGNIVTDDGVFEVGKTTKIRVHINYLMYILRNVDVHGAAISSWLDSLKVAALPMRQAAWGLAINGQEIDLDAELQDADEAHANEWYSHTINSVNINPAVLDAAYAVMARVLDPTLTAAEAREMGKLYRNAAEQ